MNKKFNDKHFKLFAKSLQDLINGYGGKDKDFTERQKQQVESLVKAEKEFKKVLKENKQKCAFAYKQFIKFILEDRRNILASRPYFRERQSIFSVGISPAIKKRRHKQLYKFNINYTFIAFVINALELKPSSKIVKAANEVARIRKEIVELNMPLAISRARIFRQKTPVSHLEYMDLVQISMEGLINAVDKFVLPYTPVFRSVIIGRVVGDLIENYSETTLHFWPSDKRKIYRANKAQKNKTEVNFEELSKNVNSGVALDNPTNPSEIQHLMAAAIGVVSIDATHTDQESGTEVGVLDHHFDVNHQPDVIVENNNLHFSLKNAINSDLTLMEQKLLQLKGINI